MGRLNARAIAVALAVVLVGAGTLAVAGTVAETTGDAGVPATPDTTDAAVATQGSGMVQSGTTPADRLACTNGTSEAVLACGYTPGPNAVSLASQDTRGGSLTVEAVELEADGFVALHRVAYVDGAFTESVVGVSSELEAGLHRDVSVTLDSPLARNESHRLLAVVYEDGDDDGSFDFVATEGATDRPFTNTYSMAAGNVTDEPGDVIGDHDTVSVEAAPRVADARAGNLDDDTALEDIDGDGDGDVFDAMAYYNNRDSATVRNNPGLFDFDGDGEAGTLFDAIALYNEL